MLRLVQRRPLVSVAATTIAGTLGYATYVEKKANIESKYSIPREYNRDAIAEYWKERPISILSRISTIGSELVPIFARYIVDFKILNIKGVPNHLALIWLSPKIERSRIESVKFSIIIRVSLP